MDGNEMDGLFLKRKTYEKKDCCFYGNGLFLC